MYTPDHFKCEDRDRLFSFMEAHSFATLVSQVEGRPFASHLPMLIEKDQNCIFGHMAKANPHWQSLVGQPENLVIFNGPHGYVSPDWYIHPNNVPTWNYVAIHVYGDVKLISDPNGLEDILKSTTERLETINGTGWSFDSVGESKKSLYNAIVGFRMDITTIEGKVKMSQNRRTEDARGARDGLKSSGQGEVAGLVDEFCSL